MSWDLTSNFFSLRDPVLGPQELKPIRFLARPGFDEMRDDKSYQKNGKRHTLEPPMLPKFRTFAMPELITNQSFCFEGLPHVTLMETLTSNGLTYMFNQELDLMNLEQWFQNEIIGNIEKNVHFFRVSVDFFGNSTLQAECKTKEVMSNRQTFKITLKGLYRETFFPGIGSLEVIEQKRVTAGVNLNFKNNKDMKVGLRPTITTTEDSLKRYKPQQ